MCAQQLSTKYCRTTTATTTAKTNSDFQRHSTHTLTGNFRELFPSHIFHELSGRQRREVSVAGSPTHFRFVMAINFHFSHLQFKCCLSSPNALPTENVDRSSEWVTFFVFFCRHVVDCGCCRHHPSGSRWW